MKKTTKLRDQYREEFTCMEGSKFRYPDAAWRPRPRDPPVTTATFPEREKMEGKSFKVVWALASAAMIGGSSMGQVSLGGGEE